jgi:hypothetical protein
MGRDDALNAAVIPSFESFFFKMAEFNDPKRSKKNELFAVGVQQVTKCEGNTQQVFPHIKHSR